MPPLNKTYNYKIKNIQLEDMKLKTPYALTINAEKMTGKIHRDYKEYTSIVYNLLEVNLIDHELYFEYSPSGRLHLHGVFKVHEWEQIGQLYNSIFNIGKISSIKIDTIDDKDTWMEYCRKQRHVMQPYLNQYQLHSKIIETYGEAIDYLNKA